MKDKDEKEETLTFSKAKELIAEFRAVMPSTVTITLTSSEAAHLYRRAAELADTRARALGRMLTNDGTEADQELLEELAGGAAGPRGAIFSIGDLRMALGPMAKYRIEQAKKIASEAARC